jgi:hypothetical protein
LEEWNGFSQRAQGLNRKERKTTIKNLSLRKEGRFNGAELTMYLNLKFGLVGANNYLP